MSVPTARLIFVALSLVIPAGCDRGSPERGDASWESDSIRMASSTGVLFRAIDHEQGDAIVPIALMGPNGLQRIRMADRGWRALDSLYLHANRSLRIVREGRAADEVHMRRGMWEPTGALDSLPGCPRVVPAGLTEVPLGVRLLVADANPQVKSVAPLAPASLERVLATIPTLIAPAHGIAPSELGRYRREVHVLTTGATSVPTIVVVFNDPQTVPDTVSPSKTQRPRQLVVVLDRGSYDYRTTHVFNTLGNSLTPPRRSFLGHVDIDGDSTSELLFDAKRGGKYESTIILRFGRDQQWREVMDELVRCQI